MEYDSLDSRFVIKPKIPDGRWNVFLNNRLIEESTIIDSEKNGIDILYDFKGRKFSIRNFTHNKLTGYELDYDSTGFVLYQYYILNNNVLDNAKFDENGNLIWRCRTFTGYSLEQTFYPNGQKKTDLLIPDSSKKVNILQLAYSSNIIEISVATSPFISVNYDSIHLNDEDVEEEGDMYSVREGEKDFTLVVFHNYTRAWYENGKIKEEISNTNSLGTEKIYYYPNGSVRKKGRYLKNIRNGEWVYYNEKGVPTKNVLYNLGKVVLK